MLIMIAGGFIALSHWIGSAFLSMMAGLVTIVAGVDFIIKDPAAWTHLVFGVAIIAVGIYLLIMVGVDFFKGG